MVPLRFVKIPPQGTENKWTRQEKKYEASEMRKVVKKAYTILSMSQLKAFLNLYSFKILCLL